MSKRFCLREHDTDVVGRTPQHHCRECEHERSAARYAANPDKEHARHAAWWAAMTPIQQSQRNTLQSLGRIRERRGRYVEQIKELMEVLNG